MILSPLFCWTDKTQQKVTGDRDTRGYQCKSPTTLSQQDAPPCGGRTLVIVVQAHFATRITRKHGGDTTCCRISVVCPKDRSRTARQLQAHSACRCQRASIQDIPVRVLRLKRTGFVAAQLGNCALAEVTAVIDTSAAAMRVLNVVIVVLRVVVLCGEFALAITAALGALPTDFLQLLICQHPSAQMHRARCRPAGISPH